MTTGENLIQYVAQQVEDAGGAPTVTKILKIIYLIDVEYFRRRRQTLTGWNWVFYKYGPYVFEYPRMLENLGLADLAETEAGVSRGRPYSLVHTRTPQLIDDFIPLNDSFAFVLNRVIKEWALENLEHLLDFIYFETEPMQGAEKGRPLDFNKIPKREYEPMIDWEKLAPPKELKAQVREKLAELRKGQEQLRTVTRVLVSESPLVKDDEYIDALEIVDQEMNSKLPSNTEVKSS